MAKFRKARRSFRGFRKSARRSHSSGMGTGSLVGTVLAAGAYGAARGYLSAWAAPITNKIPGGVYADNIVLGGAAYLLAKKGPSWIKGVAKSGLVVEAALAGSDLAAGMTGGSSGSTGFAYG